MLFMAASPILENTWDNEDNPYELCEQKGKKDSSEKDSSEKEKDIKETKLIPSTDVVRFLAMDSKTIPLDMDTYFTDHSPEIPIPPPRA
ncbi:hypothetical protein B7P33_08690 [Sediminicola luteus]|uniref:Uncharacterized protein n=2 Tax=Sediminicola luteus TaxID=319238 RepID=A0A2A4G9C0_9FLAO|nr:hypothetical protein B7P33_08690 [Sediminicola luteus]